MNCGPDTQNVSMDQGSPRSQGEVPVKHSFLKNAAGFGLAVLLSASALAAPKRLSVVTATQGYRHSSIPLAEKVLAGLGEQSGLFTVDYARGGPDGKGNQDLDKLSPDSLKDYDGVIFANTTGDLPLPDRDGFIKWVQSG